MRDLTRAASRQLSRDKNLELIIHLPNRNTREKAVEALGFPQDFSFFHIQSTSWRRYGLTNTQPNAWKSASDSVGYVNFWPVRKFAITIQNTKWLQKKEYIAKTWRKITKEQY